MVKRVPAKIAHLRHSARAASVCGPALATSVLQRLKLPMRLSNVRTPTLVRAAWHGILRAVLLFAVQVIDKGVSCAVHAVCDALLIFKIHVQSVFLLPQLTSTTLTVRVAVLHVPLTRLRRQHMCDSSCYLAS